MALDKKDKDLFKRFIDIVFDLDENMGEKELSEKLHKLRRLDEDVEKRKAELEEERAKRLCAATHCNKPIEPLNLDVADVFALFMLGHQDNKSRRIDLGEGQFVTFAWEDDILHLSYEDYDNKESGGCSMNRPSKDEIKDRLNDMFGAEED